MPHCVLISNPSAFPLPNISQQPLAFVLVALLLLHCPEKLKGLPEEGERTATKTDLANSSISSGLEGLRSALPPGLNLTVERLSPTSVRIGWKGHQQQGSGGLSSSPSYTIKVVSQQASQRFEAQVFEGSQHVTVSGVRPGASYQLVVVKNGSVLLDETVELVPTSSSMSSPSASKSTDEANYEDDGDAYSTMSRNDSGDVLLVPPLSGAGENRKVQPEEVAIVAFILILWVCAIVLFVRRWGKIRMLEPAQPAYVYEEAAAKADADKGAKLPCSRSRMNLTSPTNEGPGLIQRGYSVDDAAPNGTSRLSGGNLVGRNLTVANGVHDGGRRRTMSLKMASEPPPADTSVMPPAAEASKRARSVSETVLEEGSDSKTAAVLIVPVEHSQSTKKNEQKKKRRGLDDATDSISDAASVPIFGKDTVV